MNRAAFFDRDGTINVDTGYLYQPDKLKFIPGIPELIKKFNDSGYVVIVVTNQSGVARGLFNIEQLKAFNDYINKCLFVDYGARIDAFYCCTHLPEINGECDCRKPKPGLFLRAIKEFNIDVTNSISFGDSKRDEEASKAAGIKHFIYI